MTSAAAMCVRVDDVTPHHWTRTTTGVYAARFDRTTTGRRREEEGKRKGRGTRNVA